MIPDCRTLIQSLIRASSLADGGLRYISIKLKAGFSQTQFNKQLRRKIKNLSVSKIILKYETVRAKQMTNNSLIQLCFFSMKNVGWMFTLWLLQKLNILAKEELWVMKSPKSEPKVGMSNKAQSTYRPRFCIWACRLALWMMKQSYC